MSHIWPKRWTGTIARVRSVIAASMFATLRLPVSGSTSTNTGFAPASRIAVEEAMNVIGVVITSSPGPTPSPINARCSAPVQLVTPIACRTFRYSANCFSKRSTQAPVVSIGFANTSATASSSGFPRSCMKKGTGLVVVDVKLTFSIQKINFVLFVPFCGSVHLPLSGRSDDGNVAHPDLRAPPRFIVTIPANGALESFFEAEFRLPINELLQFRRVGSVSKHLSGAAADKLYLAVAWPHRAQHCFGDFQHAAMSFRADVDYLSAYGRDRSVNQRIQRLAVIFDIEPVSGGLAITVNRQRFAQEHARDESRHGLFEMLVWAIVIEGPDDDCRNVVRRPVRVNQTIRAALRRRIRTHRIQRMFLRHLVSHRGSVDL